MFEEKVISKYFSLKIRKVSNRILGLVSKWPGDYLGKKEILSWVQVKHLKERNAEAKGKYQCQSLLPLLGGISHPFEFITLGCMVDRAFFECGIKGGGCCPQRLSGGAKRKCCPQPQGLFFLSRSFFFQFFLQYSLCWVIAFNLYC